MPEFDDDLLSYRRALQLAGLIHKVREKEILTEEEQRELDDWLSKDLANRARFESLIHREKLTAQVENLLRYDEEDTVSAVFAAIGRNPARVIPLWKTVVRGGIVAASLLLLLGVGWRFFVRVKRFGQQDKPTIEAGAARAMEYRAVLTLADGRQLTLDGPHTGLLAVEGPARIEQGKEGLVYTEEGKGTGGYNTLTVPRGANYHVILTDRSEIWLNAASSIRYPANFTGNTRELTITGEGYFRVAKDAAKPFLVRSPKMKVEVLGTEFNVMAYPDEETIRATLFNGVVRTSTTDDKGQTKQLLLQPGEQAVLNRQSDLLRSEKTNLDEVAAWRFGRFSCDNTPLAAIMRQLARWYEVTIEYRGSVDHIVISGDLSRKPRVEDVLDILTKTRKVHFEISPNKTVVVIPGPK